MKIVLVGAGGYGQTYLRSLDELNIFGNLCGVADPYASGSSYYNRFKEAGIPVYDTLDEFYKHHSTDLAIVSSPIHFHEEQTVTALSNNSHVLCEKPVAATVGQALNMQRAAEANNRLLGVGFQWSFSSRIRAFKQDVINGRFGAPLCFKSMMYWPRPNAYYESGNWKGRLKAPDGKPINDSVITNATAHYLHNLFFMLGNETDASLMPEFFEGSVFRFRDIESLDTCIIRGRFPGGARFHYGATHSCGGSDAALFACEFESCVVLYDINMNMVVRWKNGVLENLQYPADDGLTGKLAFMIDAIKNNTKPYCGIGTVLPQMTVTTTIFDTFTIQNFPPETVVKTQNPDGANVPGLYEAMLKCFRNELLPNECDIFPFKDARVNEARIV